MKSPSLDQVRQIVSDTFNVSMELVGPKSSTETIAAWDSIAHLNLVLSLEQSFGISFDPDEIAEITSIQIICSTIDTKISQKS